MRNFWNNQSALRKALLIFVVSFLLALPLFYAVSQVFDVSVAPIVASSAIGWFAGGAIIGTYAWYTRK